MCAKRNSILTTVLLIVLALAALMLYGWSLWLYSDSIMPVWMPIAGGVIVGGATASFYANTWARLLRIRYKVVCVLWHLFLFGAVGAFVVLGGNYYGASTASDYTDTITIVNRYSEKRDTYRSVGRNRRVKSGTRTDYKVTVQLPDSISRNWTITLSRYNKVRVGQTYQVTMRRGLLGYPVIVNRPF